MQQPFRPPHQPELEAVGKKHLLQLRFPVRTRHDIQVDVDDFVQGFGEALPPGLFRDLRFEMPETKAADKVHGGIDIVSFQSDFDVDLADLLQPDEMAVIIVGGEKIPEPCLDGVPPFRNRLFGREKGGRVGILQQKSVEVFGKLIRIG